MVYQEPYTSWIEGQAVAGQREAGRTSPGLGRRQEAGFPAHQVPYSRPVTTPSQSIGGGANALTAMTLVRAYHAVSRVFVATLAPYELSGQQFSVLMNLVEAPGRGQAELARKVLATPQSVGELLRGLEERGLVQRTPPERKGLPFAVSATPQGQALLEEITPLVVEAFSPASLGLDERDYHQLNDYLHTVLDAMAN